MVEGGQFTVDIRPLFLRRNSLRFCNLNKYNKQTITNLNDFQQSQQNELLALLNLK